MEAYVNNPIDKSRGLRLTWFWAPTKEVGYRGRHDRPVDSGPPAKHIATLTGYRHNCGGLGMKTLRMSTLSHATRCFQFLRCGGVSIRVVGECRCYHNQL
jgi:hypothetical protein